jgi:uncharacterized RDD family membrane protein YckC
MRFQFPRGPETFTPASNSRLSVLAGLRLASFARRASALAIDFLLAGVIFLALTLLVGGLIARAGLVNRDVRLEFTFFHNWYSVVWLVVYFSLGAYWGRGRSPGKRLLGLRVVSLTHERLSFWHSVERALGYGASTLEAGFGFLQYFLHPYRQTVHDRIAETIVVDERRRQEHQERSLR